MLPPEHRGGHNSEQEPLPYYQAARFGGEEPAGQAYFRAQEAIFKAPESDISVYRFQFNQVWHIAVLGDPPPDNLSERLQTILTTGEPVPLDPFILDRSRSLRNNHPGNNSTSCLLVIVEGDDILQLSVWPDELGRG